MDDVKEMQKNSEITEDDKEKLENQIQKLTDKYVETIDEILDKKEKDIMNV